VIKVKRSAFWEREVNRGRRNGCDGAGLIKVNQSKAVETGNGLAFCQDHGKKGSALSLPSTSPSPVSLGTYPDRLGGNPTPENASRQALPPRRQVEPGAEVESGMLLPVPLLRDLECQRTALRLTLLRLCGERYCGFKGAHAQCIASFGRPPY
jgi:hypothetical protein